MIFRPLIVYNSNIAQSETDAVQYCSTRGFPLNILGIALNATDGSAIEQTVLEAGGYVVSAVYIDGVFTASYNALAAPAAIRAVALAANVDAVFSCTHVPVQISNTGPANEAWLLPAMFARYGYEGKNAGSSADLLPFGRLGFPEQRAGFPSNYARSTEMVRRDAQRVFTAAVAEAIAAEGRFNFDEPMMAYDGTAATLVNTVGVNLLGNTFGFTASWYADYYLWMRQRFRTLRRFQIDYPLDTADTNDWYDGTARRDCEIFGSMLPMSLNVDAALASLPYLDAYRMRPGGFWMHWYSYQHHGAMVALHNGAACAMFTGATGTFGDPTSGGVRNPRAMLERLVGGLSFAECMTLSSVTSTAANGSFPLTPSGIGYAMRQCPCGDPAYRPYAVQTRPQIRAPRPMAA